MTVRRTAWTFSELICAFASVGRLDYITMSDVTPDFSQIIIGVCIYKYLRNSILDKGVISRKYSHYAEEQNFWLCSYRLWHFIVSLKLNYVEKLTKDDVAPPESPQCHTTLSSNDPCGSSCWTRVCCNVLCTVYSPVYRLSTTSSVTSQTTSCTKTDGSTITQWNLSRGYPKSRDR